MSGHVIYFMQKHKSLGKLNIYLVDTKVKGSFKKVPENVYQAKY